MRRIVAGSALGLLTAVLVLGAAGLLGRAAGTGLSPFDAIEFRTYDWRLTRTADPSTARRDIVLVEIDEYSLRNVEPYAGKWPWPRVVHSMLVDYLARGPAKVI